MKRIIIIPTAGLATRLSPLNQYYPKALIPVADQPVLADILHLYRYVHVDRVILIVTPGSEYRFSAIISAFQYCFPIELVTQAEPLGLLHAIYQAKHAIAHTDQVIVHLADTYLEKRFYEREFIQDFILVSEVKYPHDWCMAEVNADSLIVNLVDKPLKYESHLAVIGVYFFSNAAKLLQSLEVTLKYPDISACIKVYNQSIAIKAIQRRDWHDMGNIKHLHQLDEYFATHKAVSVYRNGNVIIKKADESRIRAEEYFYRHVYVPDLFPRLLSTTKNKLSLSYQPMRSLAYYALFEPIYPVSRKHIVDSLWDLLKQNFYSYKAQQSDFVAQTQWMYGQRVLDAIDQSCGDMAIVNAWRVNDQELKGIPLLRDILLKKAKDLAKSARLSPIHGDLHLGNILYDPISNTFQLLDPRGMWGKQYSLYGDIRYDLAKFLHSLHGGYEYIKRGLSTCSALGHNAYTLIFPTDDWETAKAIQAQCEHFKVAMDDILWIEALCFLSMTRCYPDEVLRKQFFLRGLYLINQLL